MEIATSQSHSRLWRPALVGAATAFAWIVLSLLLGLGSGYAQAADGYDDHSLLGAATSVVDQTASAVTETASAATSGVTAVVNTVVATAPAPVQQPVREAAKAAVPVVVEAAQPVAEVASGGVVGSVAEPVVETVKTAPVVGDVVSAVGADDAVVELGGTVDETLSGLTGAVSDAGAAVTRPPAAPGFPGFPGLPAIPVAPDPSTPVGGLPLPALDVVLPAAVAGVAVIGGAAASVFSAFLAAFEPGSAASTIALPWSGALGPFAPAGGLCPPSALFSGPGGAGSGAWALVALGPLVALRAWVRRAGAEDEHAPPAPAGSTDVSPD